MNYNIPKNYSVIKKGSAVLVLADKYREQLLKERLFDTEAIACKNSDDIKMLNGRGGAFSVPLDGLEGRRVVIRHYEHGGLLRKLFCDVFLGSSRPLRELNVTCKAIELGIPGPEIIAVYIEKYFGVFSRNWLVTMEEKGAVDVASWLEKTSESSKAAFLRKKRTLLAMLADTVRNMHEKGILHGDLNLRNILVREDAVERQLVIVDFDKSKYREKPGMCQRLKNLFRLNRSVEKLTGRNGSINARDKLRFMKYYFKGGGKLDRKVVKSCLLSQRIHSLLWKLT